MKFRTGFVLGAAAGAWAVTKASGLQRVRRGRGSQAQGSAAEDATERLRALSGLARERLSEVMEGPIGNMARERLADLIGTSVSNAVRGAAGGKGGMGSRDSVNGSATIDTSARWPR